MKIVYQECDGRLLNVYRDEMCNDLPEMEIGEVICDPSEHYIDGEPHTTLRRVE